MSYSRKLQRIGNSIFVSLPKAWIQRIQFDRGDSVELIEQPDGSIAIYPPIKTDISEQTTLTVDVNESIRSLKRRITGAYVDGFDIINLKSEDKFSVEQQEMIRQIAGALFGLEIVELTSDLITVQCLLTRRIPIEKTIQRIHKTINSMLTETFIVFIEENQKLARSIINRMLDVKRLSLVMHRLLRSQILFPTKRSSEMKLIDGVDFLRVLDKITEISGSVKKITESTSKVLEQQPSRSMLKPLHKICLTVQNTYNWSIQALISKNVSLANRVLDEELETDFNKLWNALIKVEEKAQISTPAFSHIHRIFDNLKQIHIHSMEIAEIAIDRAEEISQD